MLHGDILYVANGSQIDEFTPDGIRTTFASGLDVAAGLAFDSSGYLFEADYCSGHIYESSPSGIRTPAVATFTSSLPRWSPDNLRFRTWTQFCQCGI